MGNWKTKKEKKKEQEKKKKENKSKNQRNKTKKNQKQNRKQKRKGEEAKQEKENRREEKGKKRNKNKLFDFRYFVFQETFFLFIYFQKNLWRWCWKCGWLFSNMDRWLCASLWIHSKRRKVTFWYNRNNIKRIRKNK